MAYGIVRARNLHQGDLKSTEKHNSRDFAPGEIPANIIGSDYEYYKPRYDVDGNQIEAPEECSLDEAVARRFAEVGIIARRDAVVAIEYVVTLSPDAMQEIQRQKYSTETILQHLGRFIEQKHGYENVMSIAMHYDESNPHAHIVVTPILRKEVKWKNARGSGTKVENRLCARDFTGGPEKLRQLQTDYFNYITVRTDNSTLNIAERFKTIDFKRGVDARNRRERKEFYCKMTDHVLGGIRKEMFELRKQVIENKITIKDYEERSIALETKISTISANIERKEVKDRQIYKKGENWVNTSKDLGM
jgi:hypothetical protein